MLPSPSLATGVVVDTHVARLAGRLGLSKHGEPEKIEQDLMRLFPASSWIALGHRLILHGRRVCAARKPGVRALQPRRDLPKGGRVTLRVDATGAADLYEARCGAALHRADRRCNPSRFPLMRTGRS